MTSRSRIPVRVPPPIRSGIGTKIATVFGAAALLAVGTFVAWVFSGVVN